MHLPPTAAVPLVSHPTTSPVSSLWKVWALPGQKSSKHWDTLNSQSGWWNDDDDSWKPQSCCRQQCGLSIWCKSPATDCIQTEVLTEHVATAILAASLIRDVGLDAQKSKGEILDRELSRVNTTDDRESMALMDIIAERVKNGTKAWKREVLASDKATI